MNDQEIARPRRGRWVGVGGVLAAGAIGGALVAGTLSASAATGASPSPATSVAGTPGARMQGHGGAQPVRSNEKALSATTAATLRAAALKAVPGGTVYRVETDAGDGAYEAHMTKADGTLVTVKFDSKLAVTKVEAGMGVGDPTPPLKRWTEVADRHSWCRARPPSSLLSPWDQGASVRSV